MTRRGSLAIGCSLVSVLACSGPDPRRFDEQGANRSSVEARGVPVSEPNQPHRHELDVDWMEFGEPELYESALAIVRGRVVAQRAGQHRTYPYDVALERTLTAEEAGDEYAELPLTISVVEVSEPLFVREGARALAGEPIDAGSRIEVVQLGGRYEHGCFVEPNDQPLLRAGDEVIAYVKRGMVPHDAVSTGTGVSAMYSIIGGKQGHLPIVGGVLAPLPDTVFARYRGRTIGEVGSEIRRIARD